MFASAMEQQEGSTYLSLAAKITHPELLALMSSIMPVGMMHYTVLQTAMVKTIATANRIFAPSPDDIASFRKIIAAYAEATAQGKGVVVVDGRLIENLHVEEAHRVVALAEAITDLKSEGSE